MARLYTYRITDTELVVSGVLRYHDRAAFDAICAWLNAHGIDEGDVLTDRLITRDVDGRRIGYWRPALDADGNKRFVGSGTYAVEQAWICLDEPPAPFPASLFAHGSERINTEGTHS